MFGLPGFKHEDEISHALQCAAQIRKNVNTLVEVKYVTQTGSFQFLVCVKVVCSCVVDSFLFGFKCETVCTLRQLKFVKPQGK